MYKIRHRNCNTSSVCSEIKWYRKHGMAIPEYAVGPIRNLYLALPQGTNSPPTRFSATTGDDDVNLGPQTLIRGATFLVIFAMTLPPQRFLALSRTMIRRSPLFPRLLSVQLHRPSPHLHHPVSTTVSRPCRSLTTRTPFARLLKASAFLSPHQIKPLLMRYETLSP